jgi:hypothetical protein
MRIDNLGDDLQCALPETRPAYPRLTHADEVVE